MSDGLVAWQPSGHENGQLPFVCPSAVSNSSHDGNISRKAGLGNGMRDDDRLLYVAACGWWADI